jgi:hypothetical protein
MQRSTRRRDGGAVGRDSEMRAEVLRRAVNDYVTLFDVYDSAINPDRIAEKLAEGVRQFAQERPGHAG